MSDCLKIGLTGGIGSGKSTVADLFSMLGIQVFKADVVARQIQDQDSRVRQQIEQQFGSGLYRTDGTLNRQRTAQLIFNDLALLEAMNAIIHPVVREKFQVWMKEQHGPYILYEAAILFESGSASAMDQIIVVSAEENIRINRVLQRDRLSEQLVRDRIKNQLSESERRKLANHIIENNPDDLLIPQVLRIDQQLKVYGKIW